MGTSRFAGPRSIRVRVTALATALVAALLVVTGVVLVSSLRNRLIDGLDDGLVRRGLEIRASLEGGMPPTDVDDDVAWQLVSGTGAPVGSSNLAGVPPLDTIIGVERRANLHGEVASAFEDSARVIGIDGVGGEGTLYVIGGLEDIEEPVAVLAWSLAVVLPVAVGTLGVLVWFLVGRTLRPVDAIAAEVAAITATDLYRRVPSPTSDDEIAHLARTMNDMLDRVEAGVEAQRRFVGDASHELRSPITRLRTQLETAQDDDDPVALRRSLLEDIAELARLVDDLLFLARADDPAAPRRSVPVDLDDIVLREVERQRATANGVRFDASAVSGAEVTGDAGSLRRAVRNLLDNASRHATSTVTVTLVGHDEVVMTVSDDGPGIPAHQSERVFERFTRLDDARSRDEGGAGLGLAIVREVASSHGGSVALDTAYGGGARVVLRLPAPTG